MMNAHDEVQPSAMGMRDFEATMEYLSQRPIEHAPLLALARRAQSVVSLQRQFVLARNAEQDLCGVMFAGAQTLLSHSDSQAILSFARLRTKPRAMRALIGPAATISQFMNEHKTLAQVAPRIDTLQELYVLRTLNLEPAFFSHGVAEATIDDLEKIVIGTASMIQDELGYDPSRRPTFRREILNQIQVRRWWIAQDENVRFLCRIGATTPDTMQLECIWSPLESRGQGHATRSLATICAQLLKRRNTISLAVNTTNERAVKLYERIGFVKHSSQRTLLW